MFDSKQLKSRMCDPIYSVIATRIPEECLGKLVINVPLNRSCLKKAVANISQAEADRKWRVKGSLPAITEWSDALLSGFNLFFLNTLCK